MTMNYQKRPSALTATTATVVDTMYDEAILYFAAARVAARMRMFDDALSFKQYAQAIRGEATISQERMPEAAWRAGVVRGERQPTRPQGRSN
jgi:hypothetical protein